MSVHILIVILSVAQSSASQSNRIPDVTQRTYERKSVTVLSTIFYGGRSFHMPAEHESYFHSELKRRMEMARFDVNILPDRLSTGLREIYRDQYNFSVTEVRAALEKELLPAIVKILDYEKEMRAQKLVTEAQKNTFLALKARTAGVTAAHLDQIMNSAFILVPYVDWYEIETEGGEATCTISGGVIVYRVAYNNDASSVRYQGSEIHRSKGRAQTNSNVNFLDGVNVPPREYAYRSAVKNLMENVQVGVRRAEPFTLVTPIQEVDGSTLVLGMGTSEGVRVDDGFEIFDYEERDGNAPEPVRMGYVRVTDVGRSSSTARVVFSDGISRGMSVKEFAARDIEFDFAIAMVPYTFSADPFVRANETIRFGEGTSTGPQFQIMASYATGRGAGISQLFTFIDLGIGYLSHPVRYSGPGGVRDADGFLLLAFDAGMMKKISYRRLSLVGGYALGYHLLSHTSTDAVTDTHYEMTQSFVGSTLSANLELLLDPATSVGIGVGYRLFPESDRWTTTIGGIDEELHGSLLRQDAFIVQFYLHKVMTSLSFDPWEWFRSRVGVRVQ